MEAKSSLKCLRYFKSITVLGINRFLARNLDTQRLTMSNVISAFYPNLSLVTCEH